MTSVQNKFKMQMRTYEFQILFYVVIMKSPKNTREIDLPTMMIIIRMLIIIYSYDLVLCASVLHLLSDHTY